VNRPLTRQERSVENRRNWFMEEEQKARSERGERGAMESWLRMTRSRIAKEVRAGREDVLAAYSLVNRLFMVALERRTGGDRRTWDDLLKYAQAVVSSDQGTR